MSAERSGIGRASLILALGSIASRTLGLAREILLSNLFGASRALEAFNNAVLVSRALFDLLIAGHVNSALVPVLSEIEATQGKQALWSVLRALTGLVLVGVGGLVLLIQPLAGPIAGLIGGDPETVSLSAELLRLTSPALLLMALFALYSAALYALRSFRFPAMAAAVFNGVLVIGMLIGVTPGDESAIRVVALVWIAAAFAQFALQAWGLRSGKLGISLGFGAPLVRAAMKRIGWLYVPVIGSLILDLATTRFLTYNLAAQATIAHGNTYLNWATTLMQFPQGLVATAISAAVLPTLSRFAALSLSEPDAGHQAGFKRTLGIGLRLTTTLILPAAFALAALAIPAIQVLFERGAFTATDTQITALALRLYLIGLPFAAWDLLLIYAFYARQDTLTPALVGALSLIVYTIAALLLTPVMGLFALMAADAIKHITHAVVSAILLHRRTGALVDERLAGTFFRALIAAAVMGVLAFVLGEALAASLHPILVLGIAGLTAVAIYGGLALMLGLLRELRERPA